MRKPIQSLTLISATQLQAQMLRSESFGQVTNPVQSVEEPFSETAGFQVLCYETQFESSIGVMGADNHEMLNIEIIPNPSNGNFVVQLPAEWVGLNIPITDANDCVTNGQKWNRVNEKMPLQLVVKSGVYFVGPSHENVQFSERL